MTERVKPADRKYRYKDKAIGVQPGIDRTFIAGWRGKGGEIHRVKARNLAICASRDEMQVILDAWAAGLGLEETED